MTGEVTKQILVIDDDEGIRKLLMKVFKFSGLVAVTAANGQEGLSFVRQNKEKIGCVFLDLNMSGMDGYDTFEHLRKINNELPVVIITGQNRKTVCETFRENKPFDFVFKPFTISEIMSVTDRIFCKKQLINQGAM